MCFAPQRRALFSTSQLPKVLWEWCVFNILTWKCASRHNGVHFFDISTSTSASNLVCFVHFQLEMCFVPQRRALFRHLNFRKCSEPSVLCTFWVGNVLRATTACTFSTSQLPKVVRHWGVLMCSARFVNFDLEMCFAPQRRALFPHLNFQKRSDNGVLCTFWVRQVLRATTACNFSSLIWPDGSAPVALESLPFDPPKPQILGKTEWIATFLSFCAPASSFLWLFLFSDSSHLCLSICPYCRKFDF